MIARIHILLPFSIIIPEGETYKIYEYVEGSYTIFLYPPEKSDLTDYNIYQKKFFIDKVPAIEATALRIDFHKEDFDRKEKSDCDPPESIINKVINSFLIQLRYVTRGSQIHPIEIPNVSWNLQYLNDDNTELDKVKGLLRGRGGREFNVSWVALTNEVWNNIYSLPIDYVPPEWDTLLLDADAALPKVGPSIILASTALEVFISQILDGLAKIKSKSPELWKWINSRAPSKVPTLEEQFDDLLMIFTGKSLKDDKTLWEDFKNLKRARNSFVHEGIAKVGPNIVSEVQAREFVRKTSEIIDLIKDYIPIELHWPKFKHPLRVDVVTKIKKAE